jgi:O-antigen/teichoic acid export membrane protein
VSADVEGSLGAAEVRSRAATGVAILGARGVLIYGVGVGANLLLARLLTPRDFGLFALGTVLTVVGTYVAAAGLTAALVQRPAAPARHELEAVLGVQLTVTAVLAGAAAAVAIAIGGDALVIATMVAALPVAMLRVPAVIVLERELRYRVNATADVVEALVFYAWAIVAVAAGLGVWGLATAVVARAAAGAAYLLIRGPLGWVAPRWSWRHVSPLAGFGARVQLDLMLQILREQGLNILVVVVAGLGTLGVWNLAWRVVQIPSLLFRTLSRVTFPAVSRLLALGEDVRPALEWGIASVAAMTAVAIVGLVGIAPALPDLVGRAWADVPAALLWAGVAMVLAAPLAVAAPPYLYASGQPGRVAAATLASAIVWFGVAAALLPRLGAPAVGIGWVAGGLLNSAVLWRLTVVRSGARLAARLLPPTAVALAAIATAWLTAHLPDDPVLGALAGVTAGELVVLAGLASVARGTLRDGRELAVRGLRTLRRP